MDWWNLNQNDEKRKVWTDTAMGTQSTTSSVKHGAGSGLGMYACQWNWYTCIYWWLSVQWSNRMNAEVHGRFLCDQIQANASALTGVSSFSRTTIINIEPKQQKRVSGYSGISLTGWVNLLISVWLSCIYLLKTRLKAERLHSKQGLKLAEAKVLERITRDDIKTLGSHWLPQNITSYDFVWFHVYLSRYFSYSLDSLLLHALMQFSKT